MEKDFISKRFANIRLAHNISARSLSMELGQSSQYINQIENNRKMPSMEGLLNFCDYFNISLKEFFDDEQEFPIQYKSLIKDLNKLSIEELEQVTSIAHLLAKNKK